MRSDNFAVECCPGTDFCSEVKPVLFCAEKTNGRQRIDGLNRTFSELAHMENNALHLAEWIREYYPYQDPLTHLKLQKLAFYAYGVALAFDKDTVIGGDIRFEAWKHGPVCRDMYDRYRHYGSVPLPATEAVCRGYPDPELVRLLLSVLRIYGRLDTWEIRNQSHLEQPWIAASQRSTSDMSTDEIRAHFKRKYCMGRITPPEYLYDYGSFALDGIPLYSYDSIFSLADSLQEWR